MTIRRSKIGFTFSGDFMFHLAYIKNRDSWKWGRVKPSNGRGYSLVFVWQFGL